MGFKDSKIAADFESAQKFEKLKVGNLGVYYPDGFKTKSVFYADIDRVFIRIHEVNGKMCCGNTIFQYFRMVFCKNGREIADYLCENESAMDNALELIKVKAPNLNFGVENA